MEKNFTRPLWHFSVCPVSRTLRKIEGPARLIRVLRQVRFQKRPYLLEDCDIYALPNGSVSLKKSVGKLMFDVFHVTRVKYGDLGERSVERELVGSWLPPRKGQTVSFWLPSPREDLVDAVSDVGDIRVFCLL